MQQSLNIVYIIMCVYEIVAIALPILILIHSYVCTLKLYYIHIRLLAYDLLLCSRNLLLVF